MADSVTPEFLARLKSLYPTTADPLDNPWYYVAAVAFTSSNIPDAVGLVLQYVLEDIQASGLGKDVALKMARKIRDTIFQSGMISGFPKTINALGALYAVTPDDLKDKEPIRDITLSTEALTQNGDDLFDKTYGDTAKTTKKFLTDIYPDLGFFIRAFGYGFTYGGGVVTTPLDSSFLMIASLVPNDTPLQVGWHLAGAQRNGASKAQVEAVRQIAIEVAHMSGISLKYDIPKVQE